MQGKHGRAAHEQGACSPTCCGESPRALGQKVSLGDQQACFGACREASVELHSIEVGHLQQHSHAVSTLLECQLNGAHSPHASFVANLRNDLDSPGQLRNYGFSSGCWLEFHGFRRPSR